jgi:ketosteroid isomerase-like protein
MAALDMDQAIEQFQQAGNEFHKGHSEPMLKMISRRDDVSVANPLGPAVRGWHKVVETVERAASNYREGEPVVYENIVKVVSSDMAFIVENEVSRAKVGGSQDFATVALRATVIFRKEEGVWKIVHRHADPIVSNRSVESIIQKKT